MHNVGHGDDYYNYGRRRLFSRQLRFRMNSPGVIKRFVVFADVPGTSRFRLGDRLDEVGFKFTHTLELNIRVFPLVRFFFVFRRPRRRIRIENNIALRLRSLKRRRRSREKETFSFFSYFSRLAKTLE